MTYSYISSHHKSTGEIIKYDCDRMYGIIRLDDDSDTRVGFYITEVQLKFRQYNKQTMHRIVGKKVKLSYTHNRARKTRIATLVWFLDKPK